MGWKRIIITGDAGRGKTTLADRMSGILSIPKYSTDDFYWAKKFTVKADREKSTKKIMSIYEKKKWIVEGTSSHLILPGFEKADVILFLGHKHLPIQAYLLFKRYLGRKEERLPEFYDLIRHQLFKKYRLGYMRKRAQIIDHVGQYENKVIELSSFKEIEQFVSDLEEKLRT